MEMSVKEYLDSVANPNTRKGYSARRIIKISDKLVAMIKALQQKSDEAFRGSVHGLRTNFGIQRMRAAEKLKNPQVAEDILPHSQILESHYGVP